MHLFIEPFDSVKIMAMSGDAVNLLTLQLAFYDIQEDDPSATRIMFGYISAVSPCLQDLQICGPEGYLVYGRTKFAPMCMGLEGGFLSIVPTEGSAEVSPGVV